MAGFLTRIATVVAILSLTLGALLVTPKSADAALWTPDRNECAFLTLINDYRRAHGVAPVRLSRSLGAAADFHSAYMARTDDVDHTLSGGASWSSIIRDFGYPTDFGIGENVLAGRQSAGGALNLWKSSPPHNANMLDRSWKAIGIGRVYDSSGRYDFYWTTTFGTGTHRTISC
jgi:uncharacterized protein YkwD